ncbi:hypothetical protein WN944_008201 [Citrus x changshan-huyou]|uniref:Peptidase A1 domain-containing protein n=2 Tax=Citrus TaxID=2706 RepID=A0ACB8KRM1_CITSI|nr:peptidase A1 domain-containing protein [Citrus sinensis]
MNVEMKITSSTTMVFLFLVMSANFPGTFSYTKQIPTKLNSFQLPLPKSGAASSVFLRALGSIYPLGYFAVNLTVGKPPKLFDFDFDTGSDLTWVQCDAPCTGCTKPPKKQYKPHKNTVPCSNPRCAALHWPNPPRCKHPNDQCDYEIEYGDGGSSIGALVTDLFPLRFSNGSVFNVPLTFGCGYNQHNPGPLSPPDTAGVLGLGRGRISIVSQLREYGLIRNVIGHCIGQNGRGVLFLGDGKVPSSGVAWTPMLQNSADLKHYILGPAELLYSGKSCGLKDLTLIFDSGASYAYFTSRVYQEIVSLIMRDLIGTPLKLAPDDKTLPICWRGPFKALGQVTEYFKPLALSFTNRRNSVRLDVPPEAYLVISGRKNVCLGILNGSEAEVGENNIIGEIFMQDKMVIYDNEKQRIGWKPEDCNTLLSLNHFI